jgi:iron complex transport system ATP-binding protein
MLARAIVSETDILILDEPTSALDMKNQSLILDWMRTLNKTRGLTIIFTTHLPQHAATIADDALLMFNDQSYRHGKAGDILSEENLFKLYGLPFKKVSVVCEDEEIVSLVPVFRISKNGVPR